VPATIRPARAMISTSRGDFRVIMLLAKGLPDTGGNLLDRSYGRHPADRASLLVPVEDRGGLLPVRPEAGSYGGRIVVGALFQLPAASQPGEDLIVAEIKEEHGVHPAAPLAQQTLHFLCLWDGAHHAIEDDALRRLGLAQLLPHDPQDDV